MSAWWFTAPPATSLLAWTVNLESTWVGVGGLEPPASSLSGKRSNRLSYTPGLAPGSATDATCAELGYRKPEFGAQSVSLSVTSMPPARWVTRLYITAPTVARAVISTTLIAPMSMV